MKTSHLISAILLFVLATANISGQIPNEGFENWKAGGDNMQLVGWPGYHSDSAGSFHPIVRVDDPFPGMVGIYSIRLENDPSLLPDGRAFGFVWTNKPNATGPSPNFPLLGHPEYLTGYFKWLPENGDTMHIEIKLFLRG